MIHVTDDMRHKLSPPFLPYDPNLIDLKNKIEANVRNNAEIEAYIYKPIFYL